MCINVIFDNLLKAIKSKQNLVRDIPIGATATAETLAKVVNNKPTNPHRILILCGFVIFG